MVRSWTRRSFVTFAVLSVTGVLVRVAFISRVGEDARPAGCPAPAASSSSGPAVCALRSAPPANKTVYFGFPPRAPGGAIGGAPGTFLTNGGGGGEDALGAFMYAARTGGALGVTDRGSRGFGGRHMR